MSSDNPKMLRTTCLHRLFVFSWISLFEYREQSSFWLPRHFSSMTLYLFDLFSVIFPSVLLPPVFLDNGSQQTLQRKLVGFIVSLSPSWFCVESDTDVSRKTVYSGIEWHSFYAFGCYFNLYGMAFDTDCSDAFVFFVSSMFHCPTKLWQCG